MRRDIFSDFLRYVVPRGLLPLSAAEHADIVSAGMEVDRIREALTWIRAEIRSAPDDTRFETTTETVLRWEEDIASVWKRISRQGCSASDRKYLAGNREAAEAKRKLAREASRRRNGEILKSDGPESLLANIVARLEPITFTCDPVTCLTIRSRVDGGFDEYRAAERFLREMMYETGPKVFYRRRNRAIATDVSHRLDAIRGMIDRSRRETVATDRFHENIEGYWNLAKAGLGEARARFLETGDEQALFREFMVTRMRVRYLYEAFAER